MERETNQDSKRTSESSDREELIGETAASELTRAESVDPRGGQAPGRANERAAGKPATEEVEEHEAGP